MCCIFIIRDCWYLLTFISALEKRPDNLFVAGKLNVITRIACYRCILTLSINFLNTFMGFMKDHVINQACAFVLPCKGMHNKICTVLGTGAEMWNIKLLPMDDGREPGTCVGPHQSMALCALPICGQLGDGSESKSFVKDPAVMSETFRGMPDLDRSCSVGECSFVHSETTLQWEQLRGLHWKCPTETLVRWTLLLA